MRPVTRYIAVLSAIVFLAACQDRTPTAPSNAIADWRAANGNTTAHAAACPTLPALNAEVDAVFAGMGPDANSVKSKIDQISKALAKNDTAKAREHAFNAVRFIFQKFKGPKPLTGGGPAVGALISHVFCFAGINITVNDPANAAVVDPANTTQTVTSSDSTAGTQLPPGSISEPTVLEFKKVPNIYADSAPGRGPLNTRLDQYPGFFLITAGTASGSGPAAPVVVAICPDATVPAWVRSRLRLGHEKADSTFEITPPADGTFLKCPAPPAVGFLPGWMNKALGIFLPRTLYAAEEFDRGVGGLATEFSPFDPVDSELSFDRGVGGLATEFKRSGSGPTEALPLGPSMRRSTANAGVRGTPGAGASVVATCAAVEAPWGTQLAPECRPGIIIRTRLGTAMQNVPVLWSITGGGGRIAAEQAGPVCSALGTSSATTTDADGRSGACWEMGATPGSNTASATPSTGGDAEPGVVFVPATNPFTATAIKRTPVANITCVDSVFNGSDRNPCTAVATDPLPGGTLGVAPLTVIYGTIPPTVPTTPHDAGVYTADASYAGSALYFGAIAAQKTVQILADFISAPRTFAVGETSVCAIDSTAAGLYCWGDNNLFQFGATGPAHSSPFTPPALQLGFVELAFGNSQFFCGINASRSAKCWGRGGFGQLGGGTAGSFANPPATVAGGVSWASIFTGRLSACGLSTSGVGYCWGSNQRGEVGRASVPLGTTDSTVLTTTPAAVDGGLTFISIVAGWLHACGITTSGAAYCWGDNSRGQLGLGAADTSAHRSPAPVAGGLQFAQLSLGSTYTCGITVSHQAYCWGENFTGQLGDGTTTRRGSPTLVAGGQQFAFIAAGSGFAGGADSTQAPLPPVGPQGSVAHTCALSETGVPWCWGWNGAGQVGDGTTTNRTSPTLVSGALQFTSLGVGGRQTCGRRGNAIWCWGGGGHGQLGNGSTANSPVPVHVLPPF